MYTLTIQFDTAEDLQAYLSPKDKPAAVEAKPAGKTKPAAVEPKPAPDDDALDYATHVQPVVAKFGTAHGKDAARDVLAGFEDESGEPCTKATQVAESDWPALIKKIKAAHKKADAAKAAAEADDD